MGNVHSKPLLLGYSLTRLWVTYCAANTFLFDRKLPHFGTFSAKLGSASNSKTQSYVPDFCSSYKMETQIYGYVFLAIQNSNFKKCEMMILPFSKLRGLWVEYLTLGLTGEMARAVCLLRVKFLSHCSPTFPFLLNESHELTTASLPATDLETFWEGRT